MYYPIGWHKVLNVDTQSDDEQCNILSVQANHERELFFILTSKSIHIWHSRPTVEIVCHRRSKESIEKIGSNRKAVWRADSSVIVVATDRDQLLFYRIRRQVSSTPSSTFILPGSTESDSVYRLHHDSKEIKSILNQDSRTNPPLSMTDSDSVPALSIFSFGRIGFSSIGVSCLLPTEEMLIVAARNGDIYGIHWDGNVDENFPWSLSKEAENSSDFISDLKFSSVVGGLALVYQSGRIGFLPLKGSRNSETGDDSDKLNRDTPRNSQINYFSDASNATCVEMNHRYRLVAFGLSNSKVMVCNINDLNSTLVINHELELQAAKFPHDVARLGGIKCVSYSPDSLALVVSWEGSDFALWSVFGSLLFCSQQWQLESQVNQLMKPIRITCLAWGREGFNIWLSTTKEIDLDDQESITGSSINASNGHDDDKSKNNFDSSTNEVLILSIAHSTLSSSPHLTCASDSIILISEDRVHIGPSIPHKDKFDNWFVVDIPQSYLNSSYPIRYSTVDRECKSLAVAGKQGFALYSLETNKWKFFTKKSQEEGFSICGDLIWWRDHLVMSCYNLETESFEIRAYLSREPLHNANSITQPIPMEIIRMSIFENRLLCLYSDGTFGMFMLNLRRRPTPRRPKLTSLKFNSIVSSGGSADQDEQSSSTKSTRSDSIKSSNSSLGTSLLKDFELQIATIENLVISNLQANPYCISSIALTRLHFKNNRQDDSILLNACGKLFLLEREAPTSLSTPSPTSDLSSSDLNDFSLNSHKSNELDAGVMSVRKLSKSIHFASASLKNTTSESSALSNVTFKAVSVIAANVEHFWISPEISCASDMSYFKKSLWLSCGGSTNRLQVWLPLLNDKSDPPTDLYVPDRIMLPIRCDIYPLAIRSSAPDVIEPDDAIVLGAESDILYNDSKLFSYFPYSTVKRQCRVYLHRILRELLLNQHLGYYARKIAESCQSLPYFAHCFELLLHEVLEEEATSPVPLPDPMLPQIVRFIKEFPVYLETVVHCARKSELSMWSHLFDERAVGNPRRLFQECLEKNKLDTAASCLILLQSLDRNIVSQRMVKELIRAAKDEPKFNYLIEDLENFLLRAELDYMSVSGSGSPN